jgi:magnesium chelatase family protein
MAGIPAPGAGGAAPADGDGRTTISRANAHVAYPARFQCVAAMNPCRCGYLGDASRECGRAPRCGEDYRAAVRPAARPDGPDDRGAADPAAELARAPAGEMSAVVAARVQAARDTQRARWGEAGPASNAEAGIQDLQPLLEAEAQALMETAAARLALSSRAHVRTLRVARTIADLAASGQTRRTHVAEALAFRQRVRAPA